MSSVQIIGQINEAGKLEVDLPEGLPPGKVHITIEPVDPAQAWFWTPEWQAGERQADQDIATGQYEKFDNMEDMLDDLFGGETEETSSKA